MVLLLLFRCGVSVGETIGGTSSRKEAPDPQEWKETCQQSLDGSLGVQRVYLGR